MNSLLFPMRSHEAVRFRCRVLLADSSDWRSMVLCFAMFCCCLPWPRSHHSLACFKRQAPNSRWIVLLCCAQDQTGSHTAHFFPPISTKSSVLFRPIFGSLPAPSWAPSPACSTLAPVDQPFDEVLWWCALIVAGPKTTGTTQTPTATGVFQLECD